MASKSPIEWTGGTWTPIRAQVKYDAEAIARAKGYTSLVQIAKDMSGHVGPHCEHCSAGCDHCYSETGNFRCLPHNGTGLPFDRRSRDLVDIIVDDSILAEPLHWRKPRKIFVCSQTDLFGEWVTDEMIDRVFAVVALCPQHTFQVLTKRAERMRQYFAADPIPRISLAGSKLQGLCAVTDPMRNVWLGVSVEDQATADARIPLLLQTPAAVRFVSYEPALGPVDFEQVINPGNLAEGQRYIHALKGYAWVTHGEDYYDVCNIGSQLDWVIVGGESGPGARPFDLQWARNVIAQCKAAGVPCFFKQAGAAPYVSKGDLPERTRAWPYSKQFPDGDRIYTKLNDKKGGNLAELPCDLCVRDFPEVRA